MKPSSFQIVDPSPPPVPPLPPYPEDAALRERLERIFTGQEPPPLLPIPEEVRQMLAEELARFPDLVPEEQQRLMEDWALMYHYGGQEVLTWKSPQGLAILAVGLEDAARARQHLSPERCLEVLGRVPMEW